MVGLVTTLHDPKGIYASYITKHIDPLKKLYSTLSVIVTAKTARQTIQTLRQGEIDIKVIKKKNSGIGESRRLSLKFGLSNKNIDHFHYCDFDRLLHWISKYPNELNKLVNKQIELYDFMIIGRTKRAFKTHPQIQIESEIITNSFFSFINGESRDITAGSCGLSREAAKLILKKSIEPTNATDAEWPMIIKFHSTNKLRLGYIETEGLEFENVTFLGKKAYFLSETLENYFNRIVLTRRSIEAAVRLFKTKKDIA